MNVRLHGQACFCAICAAALITHFLAQLGALVTKLGELLVLRGAEIIHSLLAVSSLTLDLRPGCVAFNDHGSQVPAQRAGFLPNGVVGDAGLFELVSNFGEVRPGALGPGCFVVGAGNRSSGAFLGFGARGDSGRAESTRTAMRSRRSRRRSPR